MHFDLHKFESISIVNNRDWFHRKFFGTSDDQQPSSTTLNGPPSQTFQQSDTSQKCKQLSTLTDLQHDRLPHGCFSVRHLGGRHPFGPRERTNHVVPSRKPLDEWIGFGLSVPGRLPERTQPKRGGDHAQGGQPHRPRRPQCAPVLSANHLRGCRRQHQRCRPLYQGRTGRTPA